jgi:hypothetical protein
VASKKDITTKSYDTKIFHAVVRAGGGQGLEFNNLFGGSKLSTVVPAKDSSADSALLTISMMVLQLLESDAKHGLHSTTPPNLNAWTPTQLYIGAPPELSSPNVRLESPLSSDFHESALQATSLGQNMRRLIAG